MSKFREDPFVIFTLESAIEKHGLNHLRVRKQYGVGWYLVLLLNYTFAVPVFFVCSFFENLFRGRNPFRDFSLAKGLAVNVARMWGLTGTVIRGKAYFYKVL